MALVLMLVPVLVLALALLTGVDSIGLCGYVLSEGLVALF